MQVKKLISKKTDTKETNKKHSAVKQKNIKKNNRKTNDGKNDEKIKKNIKGKLKKVGALVMKLSPKQLAKKYMFLVKFPVIFFAVFCGSVLFVTLAILFFFALTDLRLKNNDFATKCIKRIINYKVQYFDVDFDEIYFYKNPVKNISLKVSVSNFVVSRDLNKNTTIDVARIPKLDITIPVRQFLVGSSIPAVGAIQNVNFNVPFNKKIQLNKIVKNATNVTKKYPSIDKATKYVNAVVPEFQKLVNHSRYFLTNGVSLDNVVINFITQNPNKEDNKNLTLKPIKIVKSYTKIIKYDELTKLQKQQMNVFFSQQNDTGKIKQHFWQNFAKNIKNKITNKIKNIRKLGIEEKFIAHTSALRIENDNFSINGVCTFGNITEQDCIFDITNIPVSAIDNEFLTKAFNIVGRDNKINVKLAVQLEKNEIKRLSFQTDYNAKNIVYGDKKIGINKVAVFVDIGTNLQKINEAKFIIFGKNNKALGEILLTDIFEKNNQPNFNVKISFNDVKITDIISLTSNYQRETLQNDLQQDLILDGVIDGNIVFAVKNGKIVANENDNSRIELKKLLINSKNVNYNLQDIIFNIDVFNDKFILNFISGDGNSSVNVVYRFSTEMVDIKANNVYISGDNFNNIKKSLMQTLSLHFAEKMTYTANINGIISLPVRLKDKQKFIKNMVFDIEMIASPVEENSHRKQAIITIKKKKNEKHGNVVVDFAKSQFMSDLYSTNKLPDDKSIVISNFRFDDKNNFFVSGHWLFNEKEISNFYAENSNKKYISVNSDIFNVVVDINSKSNDVIVTADKAYIDANFWNALMVLASELNEKGERDTLGLHLKLKAKDASINDVIFKDVDADVNIKSIYIIGQGSCLMKYKNGKFNVLNFINQNGKFLLQAEDLSPVLHMLGVDNESDVSKITINAYGKNNEDKNNEKVTGYFSANLEYKNSSTFVYERFNSMTSDNFVWNHNDGLQMFDADFSGNWYDILGDFTISPELDLKLEGKIRFLLPQKRIKYTFFDKPKMKKTDGYSITKFGTNIDEFNRNLTINNVDFSTDERGKSQKSLIDEIMKWNN